MRFKQYLKEAVEEPFITDPVEIEKWLNFYNVTKSRTIHENGIVDLHGPLDILARRIDRIPFKFGKVNAYVDLDENNLTSLRGCPDIVGGYFSCQSNSIIDSIKYMPSKIGGTCIIWNTPITSLVGIHDFLKKINGPFIASYEHVKEGGIGLLLVDGVWTLLDDDEQIDDLPEPFQIIEKYCNKKGDLYECQAELIDMGFEEFAKL